MEKTELQPTAILWSGGKNALIALHRAREMDLDVQCLVTLHHKENPAHPLADIFNQASRLKLPLQLIPLDEGENLTDALKVLKERYKLKFLISGEVTAGGEFAKAFEQASDEAGIELLRPLWDENRFQLLSEVIEREIVARITWVAHTAIPLDWIGRELDVRLIADLARFENFDLSGENGEYHTLVEI